MARITRKELKTDKFALEVEHTVSFFEEHRNDIYRYGAIAAAVVLLLIGYSAYRGHAKTAREEALTQAIAVQDAPVGSASASGLSFPTLAAKDAAASKAFGDVAGKYSGTEEGYIAQYYVAALLADQGKLPEAEKGFQAVAENGSANYASLAKFSLSQIYSATGRAEQGEKLLRDLMAHPTVFVSKEQATLSLVFDIKDKNPAEARTLLEPLRKLNNSVGQMAVGMYGQLGATK